MTGLYDTDVRLNEAWALTPATDGDAPLTSAFDCLYQNIVLEAITQEGDLFYDESFGWSLCDFLKSEDDPLTRLEIAQRARLKLAKREVILPGSIQVVVDCKDDVFRLACMFQFDSEETRRTLNIILDPVTVEVSTID